MPDNSPPTFRFEVSDTPEAQLSKFLDAMSAEDPEAGLLLKDALLRMLPLPDNPAHRTRARAEANGRIASHLDALLNRGRSA